MTETISKHKIPIIGIISLMLIAAVVIFQIAINPTAEASDATAQNQESTDAEATDEAEAAVPVKVIEVATGPIASYISATANLVPEDVVTVLAEAEGRVAELKVDEGDQVRANQILAILARDEAEIARNKADLRALNTEQAYDRARGSREQGLISAEAFDKLEMEYRVAKQEVAEAEWRLARTVIRAPFAGRVTERFITVGQHIRPGDQVLTVADFEPLIARIYLPERDVLPLIEGQEARITLGADSDHFLAGKIQKIAPMVDTATGTVKVTVEAHQASAGVRPGAFVTIDIVRERREAAVLLPRESIIRELGESHVFVADGDAAAKRTIELGLEEDGMIEAVSGVASGENVIVAGQGSIEEGQSVKILDS